jgi:hypothetical protein
MKASTFSFIRILLFAVLPGRRKTSRQPTSWAATSGNGA